MNRFVCFRNEEVKEFTEKPENENENSKKKTLYYLKFFREYIHVCGENKEIEDITHVERQEIIKEFVFAA